MNKSVLFACLVALAAAPLFRAQPSLAEGNADALKQPETESNYEVNQPTQNNDHFSGTGGDSRPFTPFDFIHRANLGAGVDMRQFMLQQDENLNDAAAQFRARQLELLRQDPETVSPAQ
ncbi:hypothetical protein [[Phormidium] sp. ETS-05]|uniref:hypothetical protein n=1 Tax=[Phormidium] sp. ETS-05 TaxID=222819 RepID=UPI0018EF1468|nr:hypothetical protein [[Phormidium] sp. ETS-05]